jgi:hypothetical protein
LTRSLNKKKKKFGTFLPVFTNINQNNFSSRAEF